MAEAPTMEVRARLTAETAQFTRGLDQAAKAAENFSQTSNRLRGAMTGIGIASAAATTAIIAFGTKAFMAAARVDELDIAMNAVGKSTGLGYQVIKDATLAIKANGIEMEIAQKSALKFAQNNLELGKAADLARVAQDLAVISGMNSSDTYNMLTHAVITGRSEVLKSVGIQKSAGQMYESFAKSIGKTTKQLTYQEKQQAVLSGAITEGAKVAGTYEAAMTSPGKVLRSFARVQNEIQVAIGNVLLKGFGPLIFSAYNLVKALAKASEKSKTVQAIFQAVTMVLEKLTKPFITIIDKLKSYVENIDKVIVATENGVGQFDRAAVNVKALAEKFEFLLPAVAAIAAAFATFAGAQIFKMIPVLGTVLGGLAGPLGIVAVMMATLYLTSTQVKNAMNELFSALKPVGEAIKAVGGAFFVAASYGVSIFSFAISGLAKVISGTTDFLRQNRIILIGLTAALGGAIAAMVFFKIQTLVAAAATKYSVFITGLKAKFLNAEAVSAARAAVAEAKLAFAENTQAVAAAKAVAATRALAVQNAANNLAVLAAIPNEQILGGKRAAVAAATTQLAIASRGLTTATAQVTAAQAGATAAANTLATANSRLAVATGAVAMPLLLKIALLAALVIGFVYAWKESERFREVMTAVFDFVGKVVGRVLGFVFEMFGNLLIGFGHLIDINNTFGQVVAGVLQFVYETYLNVITGVLGFFKHFTDGFLNLFKTHNTFRQIVEEVMNIVARVVALAVTAIIVSFAGIIKGVATLIFYFQEFGKFIGRVFVAITGAISKAGEIIGSIISRIAKAIGGGFLDNIRDGLVRFINGLANMATKIPIIGNSIASALRLITSAIDGEKEKMEELQPNLNTDALVKSGKASIDIITAISSSAITGAKSWGNYKEGVAGALSTVANTMLNFNQKIVDFASKDLGGNVLNGLITAAEKVSPVLGKIITGLEKMKKIEVGDFIVKNTSEAAVKAGKFMLGLAASIKSFTESNFTEKIGGALGDLFDKLKTGLGFGNILEDLKKEYSKPGDLNFDDPNADALEESTKRLKSVRESMQAGIDSIRGVLDDLKQAAKDFADSLKDTIVNFAGLKGVELPDGFIPKAKSLIANMEQRLNKSQQFAGQIAQLQAMNLDADALKSIIEEGPIKGAQLAASILGGGQQAVDEVSRLQKAIQFAGATIGAYGSEAAFSGKIAEATSTLRSLEYADMRMGTAGTNVYIEQGAFQLMVDTSGAADADERTGLITKKIEETFAILARQLASK
jgi:phage-related protein